MAIPEELKTAVFAYCREVEDEETLDQVYELFRKKHRDDYHFIDE